jgi:pyruvate-formate lyase-activating enzyme
MKRCFSSVFIVCLWLCSWCHNNQNSQIFQKNSDQRSSQHKVKNEKSEKKDSNQRRKIRDKEQENTHK